MKCVTYTVNQLCCPCGQNHLGANHSSFQTAFMAAKGEKTRWIVRSWFVFRPVWCCLAVSCCLNTGVCVGMEGLWQLSHDWQPNSTLEFESETGFGIFFLIL